MGYLLRSQVIDKKSSKSSRKERKKMISDHPLDDTLLITHLIPESINISVFMLLKISVKALNSQELVPDSPTEILR